MAGLDGTITLRSGEYRPCFVGKKKALFHRWIERAEIVPPAMAIGGHSGGVIKAPFGIVEYEDGEIAEVYPTSIQFADNPFNDICFERGADNGQ
jgi:hypothetical protein